MTIVQAVGIAIALTVLTFSFLKMIGTVGVQNTRPESAEGPEENPSADRDILFKPLSYSLFRSHGHNVFTSIWWGTLHLGRASKFTSGKCYRNMLENCCGLVVTDLSRPLTHPYTTLGSSCEQ